MPKPLDRRQVFANIDAMSEVRASGTSDSWRTLLLVWAITATFAAMIFAAAAVFFFARTRAPASSHPAAASPLLTLQENEVIGRYKYFEGTNDMGYIQ